MENSPLNKLSAELRNRIYHLVLVHDKDIAMPALPVIQPRGTHQASLLCTCRQINREASPMFYGGNTFHMMTRTESWEYDQIPLACQFAQGIGITNRAFLRKIKITEMAYWDDKTLLYLLGLTQLCKDCVSVTCRLLCGRVIEETYEPLPIELDLLDVTASTQEAIQMVLTAQRRLDQRRLRLRPMKEALWQLRMFDAQI